MVGIARHAGHDIGIAALHGPCRPAQRHDPAGAAHRDMVEPPRREAQMLRKSNGCIGKKRERRHGHPVHITRAEPRLPQRSAQRGGDPPVRRVDRVALVIGREWTGQNDAVIAPARRAFGVAEGGNGRSPKPASARMLRLGHATEQRIIAF